MEEETAEESNWNNIIEKETEGSSNLTSIPETVRTKVILDTSNIKEDIIWHKTLNNITKKKIITYQKRKY